MDEEISSEYRRRRILLGRPQHPYLCGEYLAYHTNRLMSMEKQWYEIKTCAITGREMTPFGAFPTDAVVSFALKPADSPVSAVMVIHADGWNFGETQYLEYPLTPEGTLTLSMEKLCADSGRQNGLFYYHYRMQEPNGVSWCCGGEEVSALRPVENGVGERQLLLYDAAYRPSFANGQGILYHIFVDRFASTGWAEAHQKPGTVINPDWENGIPQYGDHPGEPVANNVFFGGDLWGIAERLPYIASLGTQILYLSPIFEAASNHKYDTGDYLRIDSMFGDDAALAHLCAKAAGYGIHVILDGVFNHTGDDSRYFNREGRYADIGAYQSPQSPYAEWYTFRQFPDVYECWWGVPILPRVRSDAPSFRQLIFRDAIPKWMRLGVDGWRLDVADELSSDFLTTLRQTVRQIHPHALLLGEVWEDASDKVSYGERRAYLYGNQLDGVMNYPLREAVISYILQGDAEALRRGTVYLYRRYPKWASEQQMNFLGTHDTVRILTALGGELQEGHSNAELAHMRMDAVSYTAAKKKLQCAYALLCGMPGIPSVFYGDEVGLEGYRDPFCRRPFPWQHMDMELLAFYQKVGRIRRRESVLADGVLHLLQANENTALFARTIWGDNSEEREDAPADSRMQDSNILIAVNRSDTSQHLCLPCDCWSLLAEHPLPAGEMEIPAETVEYIQLPVYAPWQEVRWRVDTDN